MATEKLGWLGTALRLAVGAFLMWYGNQELRQAEWLVPGLILAVAIPLAHTLGLFIFESLVERTSLSPSQLHLWNRVYFLGVLVAVALWRGMDVSVETFMVLFGLEMLLAGIFRYAGCEVMAIPNLILRRDYVVFCLLFSPIDRLERRLNDRLSRH